VGGGSTTSATAAFGASRPTSSSGVGVNRQRRDAAADDAVRVVCVPARRHSGLCDGGLGLGLGLGLSLGLGDGGLSRGLGLDKGGLGLGLGLSLGLGDGGLGLNLGLGDGGVGEGDLGLNLGLGDGGLGLDKGGLGLGLGDGGLRRRVDPRVADDDRQRDPLHDVHSADVETTESEEPSSDVDPRQRQRRRRTQLPDFRLSADSYQRQRTTLRDAPAGTRPPSTDAARRRGSTSPVLRRRAT